MDFEANYVRDCPGCGDTFTAKRLNQKFCDKLCKSQFHNNKSRGVRIMEKSKSEITGEADAILWKNREVLEKYVGKEVELKKLEDEGFNPFFITEYVLRDNDKTYYRVYDLAYLPIDGKLKIFTNA